MSQQYNYFAASDDEKVICETLIAVLGKIFIIPERGSFDEMTPKPVLRVEDLYIKHINRMICIISEDYLHSIELREISNNLYRIDYHAFPCLEYSPSRELSLDTVEVGRLAYFFGDDTPFQEKVQKLFRTLKKKSQKITGKSGFWIFEHATRKMGNLHFGLGIPKANPMYSGQEYR